MQDRLSKGSMVAFCLDGKSSDFLRSKGGLPVGRGQCGNHPYLFKKVYGVPGDYVSQDKFIFINRAKIPGVVVSGDKDLREAFKPLQTDYLLSKDQYLLISTDHPNSFDSRYFGPVNRSKIYYKVIPIWTV